MSLKSRLLALLVTTLLLIALAISAVDIDGLVATFLDTVRERSEFTAQQVKTVLLQRLDEAADTRQFTTVEQAKVFWLETLSTDTQIPVLLERTMAPVKVVVEISIARDDNIVIASTNPTEVGKPMITHPQLELAAGD